jgi:hypothetical protein
MALTDLKIRNAKLTDKQQKLFDERGLRLLVTPPGVIGGGSSTGFGGRSRALLKQRHAEWLSRSPTAARPSLPRAMPCEPAQARSTPLDENPSGVSNIFLQRPG